MTIRNINTRMKERKDQDEELALNFTFYFITNRIKF